MVGVKVGAIGGEVRVERELRGGNLVSESEVVVGGENFSESEAVGGG